MKLVYIIVCSDDDDRVMDKLNAEGFSVTKMATTGGFLKAGNTTLIVGTDEDKVDWVVDIVKEQCGPRKKITATMQSASGNSNGEYTPYPVSVEVGGATIFVVDVEKYVRI